MDRTPDAHPMGPAMALSFEPFFGQDRTDLPLLRLRQHGLQRPAAALPP